MILTDLEEYECCIVIYNFLIEDCGVVDDFKTPMMQVMNIKLNKHNTSMCKFTEYLNDKYKLNYKIASDEDGTYLEFFSNHSRQLYKRIIRNYKLNIIFG